MTDQAELSALRERIGRAEVVLGHHSEQLKTHNRYFELFAEKVESQAEKWTTFDQRLSNIEQLLNIVRWSLMTVGTMVLEAITGTLQSVLKMLAAFGHGS